MSPFLIYLLKANAAISILVLSYFLLLRNEKFFKLNRAFLIAILIFSFALPLTPAANFFKIDQIENHPTAMNSFARVYNRISKSEQPIANIYRDIASYHPTAMRITSMQIIFVAYLFVVFILLLRFLFQLFNLYRIIKQSKKHLRDGIVYCEHDRELSPFSFFNYLVINKSAYDRKQSDQIVDHEIVHIRQWHIIDILFSELAQIVLWVNPLSIVLKKYINLNLEFIADESLLDHGIDKKEYQLNILSSSFNSMRYPLTNLFNSSKLKLRIKMMNSKKSPTRNLYKYAFMLPLILVVYFIINPLSVQTLKAQVQKQIQPQEIDSVIAKSLEAMGGKDKVNALRSIHIECTVSVSGNGMSGSSIYDIVFGDRYRHETTIGGQKVILCESEATGWKMNPRDHAGIALTNNEITEYKPDLYHGGYLFNYVELGNKIALEGKEELLGKSMFKIKVTTKDRAEIFYYINANSYQLVKEVRVYKFNGQSRTRVFDYADFKKTDEGCIIPFSTTMTNPQGTAIHFTINKVTTNIDMDSKMFAEPE